MSRQEENLARLGMYVALAQAATGGAGSGSSGSSSSKGKDKKKGGSSNNNNNNNNQKKQKTGKQQQGGPPAPAAVSEEEQKRRFDIIRSVGEECVSEDDLKNLLKKKEHFRLYDGFEPSGRMHIAQGIFKALNVNKCTTGVGGTFVFWVADWFGLMNDKMGGDLEKIKVVGEYFVHIWKGAGMNLENVEFRWASDDIINNAKQYWEQMLDIAKRFTISRVKKCCQIMGRKSGNLTAAQFMYPLMQCCDIFFLKADICQLGVDQRKVNMLAREYCDFVKRPKPVILSHHMLYGLAPGQAKMSKSNPDSAIFMEDSAEEVERKISIAFCPKEASTEVKQVSEEEKMSLVQDDLKNPCLDYVQHIIMTQPEAVFKVGSKEYTTFDQVKEAFLSGELSEKDLKTSLAACINKLIQPVRDYFEQNEEAKRVLELVRQFKRDAVQPPSRLKRLSKLGTPGDFVLVTAPCPTNPELSLGTLLTMNKSLRQAKEFAKTNNKKVLLYFPDLNALACNCFGDDKKMKPQEVIQAFYKVLLELLTSMDALEDVQVHFQSEVMLQDPSNYWISVINVGRHFQAQQVQDAVSGSSNWNLLDEIQNPSFAGASSRAGEGDEARVGPVIAALMHVGDVLSIAPAAIIAPKDHTVGPLHDLSARYISACQDQQDAIPVPQIIEIEPYVSVTNAKGKGLEAKELLSLNDVASVKEHVSVTTLLATDDYNMAARKKLKQSFAEPGVTSPNPCLDLVGELVLAGGDSFTVGGKEYSDIQALRDDYAKPHPDTPGEFLIHPGDLKSAAEKKLEDIYKSKLQPALKNS